MEFKVGDRVVVDNLDRFPKDVGVSEKMYEFIGRAGIIRYRYPGNEGLSPYYLIDFYGIGDTEYYWSEEWLIEEKGNKGKKRSGLTKTEFNKAVVKARKSLRTRANHSSCCSYAKVIELAGRYYVDQQLNDICHARIGSPFKIAAIIDFIGKPKKRFSPEQYKQFMKYADYVINRSWISYAFHPTTVQNYVRNGVMLNVNCTATEVFAAVVSLRQGSERKAYFLHTFSLLVKKGYPEDFAFVMACSFIWELKGKGKVYKISLPGSHVVFDGYCRTKKIFKIARGEKVLPNGKPFREKSQSWRLTEALGNDGNYDEKDIDIYSKYLESKVLPKSGTNSVWGRQLAKPVEEEVFLEIVQDIYNDVVGAK